MRSPFRSLFSALCLTAVAAAGITAGAADAQDHGKDHGKAPKAAAPAKPAKNRTMQGSPMAKVRFSEPAYPLTDDGTYRGYMDRILDEYGRRCVRQEQFGWELAKDDQERVNDIFQGTMANFGRAGYLVGEIHPKAVTDPETIVFLGDQDMRRLLLVWAPLESSVLFMMCETGVKDAGNSGKEPAKDGAKGPVKK